MIFMRCRHDVQRALKSLIVCVGKSVVNKKDKCITREKYGLRNNVINKMQKKLGRNIPQHDYKTNKKDGFLVVT